ncbi:MAG: C45 family autoproteolytic acyltransferase/hydrolase [Candidatus Aminicenantes bacterium]|nr:C45 family autoproteolytic acyltransferase/hydrolase [Candidatus Aminicenantes bacterium]
MHFNKKIVSLLLIGMVSAGVLLAADLTKEEQSWVAKASRAEKNGWVYLHIEGKPLARGFQHGYLLAKEIAESLRVEKHMTWWNTGKEWPYFVEQTLKMFTPKIDAEYREEMEGITAGARKAGVDVSYGDILLLNASAEIMGYWYPSLQDDTPQQKTGGCSAFIATGKATSDGRIVMAHNTWSFFVPADTNVVIDLLPEKGARILMQGFPAAIHSGTDFFICSSGLVGTETTIDYFKGFDPAGIPEFVRIRKAMQYAHDLDEALKIMIDGNNGGYANTWLFGDVHSNEIARLELGLKVHSIERTRDGFYSGSNITENVPLMRQETDSDFDNIKHSDIARRVRWLDLFDKWMGKIDVERGKLMLGDHYDVYAGRENPGDRTICGHWELAPDPAGNSSDTWAKPFYPAGALDGKVVDARMAEQMTFWAKWGSSCDIPFDAPKFLQEHRQYDYLNGYLKSRPTQPWTVFKSGSK